MICYYKLSPDSENEIIFENRLIFGKVIAYKNGANCFEPPCSIGFHCNLYINKIQETRMLSQALNRAMPHSRSQLEGVDRKKLIFYLAVQLYCTLKQ